MRRVYEVCWVVLDLVFSLLEVMPEFVYSWVDLRVTVLLSIDEELVVFFEFDYFDFSWIFVVVGYGEVGSWGSVWTCWEVEKGLELSLEVVCEFSWMMGFIEFDGEGGWQDVELGDQVADDWLGECYEVRVRSYVGI